MRANQPCSQGTAPQDFRDGHSTARPHGIPVFVGREQDPSGRILWLDQERDKEPVGLFQERALYVHQLEEAQRNERTECEDFAGGLCLSALGHK